MVLKGDSCLLNGRKPMFIPDWTRELGVTDCIILRVSRLGKEIAPRFASRYYNAVAPGADFIAMDILREAQQAGLPGHGQSPSTTPSRWVSGRSWTGIQTRRYSETTNGCSPRTKP